MGALAILKVEEEVDFKDSARLKPLTELSQGGGSVISKFSR